MKDLEKKDSWIMLKSLALEKKTGIDLSGEENGILFDVDKMGPVETATTALVKAYL